MQDYVKGQGLPAFRGKQLFDAIYSGKSFDEVTNLPKNMPQEIVESYPKYKIYQKYVSNDGTIKYLFAFDDGNIVEGVLMNYKYGYTLCLSTQVGCRMGCKFCASTLHGLVRNLSAGEMLGQVLLVNRDLGGRGKERKITNLVLMGSGEPLDNYDNVTTFLKLVSAKEGLNISQRNISLSTCGIVENIYRLADDGFSVTLTISLHASNDLSRRKSMPIANKYSIQEIIEACKYYFDKTGRRIVFEYVLINGENDKDENAQQLSQILKGFSSHINVIPLNNVADRIIKGDNREKCYEFAKKLEKHIDHKQYGYLFAWAKALCDLTAVKCDIGIRLRKAYKEKNIPSLEDCIQRMERIVVLTQNYYDKFKDVWFKSYKPFGFELQDARIGGVIHRVKHCIERTKQYIEGKIPCIEELDATQYDVFGGKEKFGKKIGAQWDYKRIITTGNTIF